jgi:hypothetical protein
MCDNDEFYCPAEFQHEIVCILVYTKMTDAENMKVFYFFAFYYLRSTNLSNLHNPEYIIYLIGFFCAHVEVNIMDI